MCRGNGQAAIFRNGRDSEMFLDTLGESGKTEYGNRHEFRRISQAHCGIEERRLGFDEFRKIKNIKI